MYVDTIRIENLRAFARARVSFLHPRQDVAALHLPPPRYPNLNLLVGGNGSGKTTLLRAVALAGLGPAVDAVDFATSDLARREPDPIAATRTRRVSEPPAAPRTTVVEASFVLDAPAPEDRARALTGSSLASRVELERRGARARLRWQSAATDSTRAAAASWAKAGLLLGYGATRGASGPAAARRTVRARAGQPQPDQVRGLFDENHVLTPLSAWLPALRRAQPGRFAEVTRLLNRLLAPSGCSVTGETHGGECLFERRRVKLPLPALSDGCRALLTWLGDVLRHLCRVCPPGRKLVAQPGLVLVDEVDLHLHPQWQMQFLPTLARALPNLQFIVTSHSPLLVGSVEWTNILALQSGPRDSFVPARLGEPVHGLDADQLLLTGYFGLESTRAPDKQRRLQQLTWRARTGEARAAKELLEALSRGEEAGR
jgi:energy-coupling factor transporter ATP-binding protein EcfA2